MEMDTIFVDQPTEKRPAVFLRAVFQTGAFNMWSGWEEHKAKTLEATKQC